MGEYVRDILLCQNYFETIFTRIPKKVGDEIVAVLRDMGLQHSPVGNGGQGGPDRRGGDDGRARPASVKVRSTWSRIGPAQAPTRIAHIRITEPLVHPLSDVIVDGNIPVIGVLHYLQSV